MDILDRLFHLVKQPVVKQPFGCLTGTLTSAMRECAPGLSGLMHLKLRLFYGHVYERRVQNMPFGMF